MNYHDVLSVLLTMAIAAVFFTLIVGLQWMYQRVFPTQWIEVDEAAIQAYYDAELRRTNLHISLEKRKERVKRRSYRRKV